MNPYHVCIDPGHGPGCANRSPDGSYEEQEFAMDLSRRIAAILEENGVRVTFTRDEAAYPSLSQRCRTANAIARLDLFVSIHSNAAGSSGWSNAAGYMAFTSGAGESAGRNRAAKAILRRWEQMGLSLRGGGLHHYGYSVLTGTTAPAVLLEHGFHSNRADVAQLQDGAFRQKLAQADAMGILDFLGIVWRTEAEAPAIENPHRQQVQSRFGLEAKTMDYLEAYAYGDELLRKLAGGV